MSRAKLIKARLGDLPPDQPADFFVLLAARTRGTTRDGKPYYLCRFRDARRTVSFMAWADGPWYEACERDWREGQFFKVRGAYSESERYGPQIDIQNIRPVKEEDRADGFNPADLVESSRYDPEKMFAELKGLAEAHIADEPLRRLVLGLLDKHAEPLRRLPATQNRFHPFRGGLLEHTLSVAWTCLQLVEKYQAHYADLKPPLNKDLVVAAAVLHDLGRVAELDDNPVSPQPTVPGRLLGHLFLGRDLVRDAARQQGDVNPELLQLLEHVIISHLNLPEWGSPRLPLVPESLILHHADDLDAKLEMYARCLSRDQAPGPFTDRDPALNRQLYKGRSV
ncbi:MAG TPA: HD domain-containing protein [Gemmataceae bacterium]|nr:HD domain-containing protein [Gemmataceae bacterium]